jgi:hypothetical protein
VIIVPLKPKPREERHDRVPNPYGRYDPDNFFRLNQNIPPD